VSGARWREVVTPPPPPALAAAVEAQLDHQDDVTPELYLEAAERLLAALLKDGCTSRESALDLLVADALVTYAFEAAADEPARIIERAHRAMVRIAAFAVDAAPPSTA
jgi:uncharacterized membrane protein